MFVFVLLFWALLLASIPVGLFALYLLLTSSREPNLSRSQNERTYLDPSTKQRHEFPSLEDNASLSLSVIVPAYKEEERLPVMMEETLEYLEKRKKEDFDFHYEIIIVDDGSTDKTTEVALEYVDKYGAEIIRVLTFDKNRGKGGAVRMGMLSARGRRLLMVDADGASKFSDLDKLEKALDESKDEEEEKMAIAVGSRAHMEADSVVERSFFRTFLMKGFHMLVLLCVRGVKDTQCGFKLFTRSVAQRLFPVYHVERWAFDVELLYIAEQLNIPIKEVAITWHEVDGSKIIPVFSWLQMGRDILFIRLRYLFGIWSYGPRKLKEN
ncbi:dolichyl-phosphate beta-glucosyltransferase-like isoform X2 [Dysidea avara]|uniref:dolichyl-phosphate beta-glucosyltransferase-like isoform X2 n=1 Tax=Dysidea avara TaxID=196820 RepID=UPI003326F925